MAKEIKIVIERRGKLKLVQKQEFSGHLSAKGIIARARETDYLPRRLKKSGGIRFFDLGRLASGADVSGFTVQPAFPHVDDVSGYPAPTASMEDFAALENYLLNLEGDSFESKFYEIKRADGDFYRLQVFGDEVNETLTTGSDLWTDNGLKLTPEQLADPNFQITINSPDGWRYKLFFGFKISGAGAAKVTIDFDYDVEAIEDFKLADGDLVFIYPVPCAFTGNANWFFGGRYSYLHYDLRLAYRARYVADQSPVYDPQHVEWSRTSFSSEPNYLEKYNALREFISLPEARAWRNYQEWDDDDVMFWDFSAVDPESGFVPNPPFSPTGDETATEMGFSTVVAPQYAAGMLLASVKRGADLYHIWAH